MDGAPLATAVHDASGRQVEPEGRGVARSRGLAEQAGDQADGVDHQPGPGATLVELRAGPGVHRAVLRDPEGDEFCA